MDSRTADPLVPQLAEAERTLEQVLDEACETRPLQGADTGELIRIEEMLAIASDAAKRAISIRRKRRQRGRPGSASPSGGVVAQMAGLEAVPPTTHRVFVDGAGERWDVWAVYPMARGAPNAVLQGSYREGWLCLESPSQKRRLSPIPPAWETLPEPALAELCARADVVAPRGS